MLSLPNNGSLCLSMLEMNESSNFMMVTELCFIVGGIYVAWSCGIVMEQQLGNDPEWAPSGADPAGVFAW
jgi:hypothetical protein